MVRKPSAHFEILGTTIVLGAFNYKYIGLKAATLLSILAVPLSLNSHSDVQLSFVLGHAVPRLSRSRRALQAFCFMPCHGPRRRETQPGIDRCQQAILAPAVTQRKGLAHKAENAMIGTEARVRPGDCQYLGG